MKVLFIIPSLGHGGAERVLINLVNNLDPKKYDITLQTIFDVGIYQSKINKNIRYIPGEKRVIKGYSQLYKLLTPKQLYHHYIKEHYDLIVSYLEGITARIVSGCDDMNTKLICWIHIEQGTPQYASKCFRNYKEAKECYSQFNRIVFVSETVKEDFENIFGSEECHSVLYNTIETDAIIEKANDEVTDVDFDKNSINIISVAKIIPTKGYDRLARVLKKLTDDGFMVHIYILGVGEQRDEIERILQTLGIDKYWTFIGFRDNPYKYVKKADLYVCSSRREGFSTAVTEALIVGTPVVSTNCSGAYELLGYNNEYGIVTDNDEESLYLGIKTILQDKSLLLQYREKALIRGKRFSKNETIIEAEKLFVEVVK